MNDDKNPKDLDTIEKELRKKYIFLCLATVPFFIGCLAYLQFYPDDYLDAAYFALRNYIMEYDFEEKSFLLELSRWSALLASTTLILSVFQELYALFQRNYIPRFQKNVVVFYGDKGETEAIIKKMKKTNDGKSVPCFWAQRGVREKNVSHHIIMYDDIQENLAFYGKYQKTFSPHSHIHLMLEGISPHFLDHKSKSLYPFSYQELLAQDFWINQGQKVKALCEEKNGVVKIFFLGDGFLLEKLLDYGLQVNIFNENQRIEYHLFGDFTQYEAFHHGLEKIDHVHYREYKTYPAELTSRFVGANGNHYPDDRLFFYKDEWYFHKEELKTADLFVICGKNDNETLTLASQLKTAFPLAVIPLEKTNGTDKEEFISVPLYLRLNDKDLLHEDTATTQNFVSFGDKDTIFTYENITNNKLIQLAIKINAYYWNALPKKENQLWHSLLSFDRDSSLLAALFLLSKKQELLSSNSDSLKPYCELEHIRWMRFHFMYNWTIMDKAVPTKGNENPPSKNKVSREHPLLIPYEQLKTKGKENLQQMLEAMLLNMKE
ncbi:MAG: hypothetical protein R3Y63_03645 [Eubacteriales bacterium]